MSMYTVADPGFLKGGFQFQLDKNASSVWVEGQKKGHQPSYFSLGSILHLLMDDF